MLDPSPLTELINLATMAIVALIFIFFGMFVFFMVRKRKAQDEEIKKEYNLDDEKSNDL